MQLPTEQLLNKDSFSSVLGQVETKRQLISALLLERHVLILGAPGIGKTTLARSVAKLLPEIEVNGKKVSGEERFVRIQGSPDLTVEDLLGDIDPIKALKFGPTSEEAFTPGKIFKADKGVLFFDELNRAPERLQNALLQVLQERHATIGSYDVDFPTDFVFIATMNPVDSNTEKVSEVLLDRFDIIYMDYPETLDLEKKIVDREGKKLCEVSDSMLTMMVHFVRLLRMNKNVEQKPSVRASLGLYERSQGLALADGRSKVSVKDVHDSVVSVIAHRITLRASAKYAMSPEQLLGKEFAEFMQAEGKTFSEEDSQSP